MGSVPAHPHHSENPRRKPLAPLPEELSGPVREFVTALRHMHGELGLSLKELEGRLPASRSSLSRYLRGQSLPDERLLVQWGKLSFTAEDRLPDLVKLLHRANEAADAPPEDPPPDSPPPDGTPSDAGARPPRRRLRLALAAAGTVAVLAGTTVAVLALRASDSSDTDKPRATLGNTRITVFNAEKSCRGEHVRSCSLGLAEDPYMAYRPANITGRAYHGDVLRADCRIANGVTVTDEAGGHSSMWFRVLRDDRRMWIPAIRIDHDQVQYTKLPNCPD
ncbi:XRE family transcriptional regulator [Streptomyces sp. NPDC059850]|uniref:XRE family transcriptional regulator n=1 Tax=Streptomyces sp. NPDC059850 TaxID=3346970 RepID=UPI00366695E1